MVFYDFIIIAQPFKSRSDQLFNMYVSSKNTCNLVASFKNIAVRLVKNNVIKYLMV